MAYVFYLSKLMTTHFRWHVYKVTARQVNFRLLLFILASYRNQ